MIEHTTYYAYYYTKTPLLLLFCRKVPDFTDEGRIHLNALMANITKVLAFSTFSSSFFFPILIFFLIDYAMCKKYTSTRGKSRLKESFPRIISHSRVKFASRTSSLCIGRATNTISIQQSVRRNYFLTRLRLILNERVLIYDDGFTV